MDYETYWELERDAAADMGRCLHTGEKLVAQEIKKLWDWEKENNKYYVSMNGVCQIEAMIEGALEEEGIEDWKELSDEILDELLSYLKESRRQVEIDNAK